MSNSQSSNSSSNTALAQLLEVDAQLAEAEADLKTQLQSIQQKRQSLKTVIDLFAAAAPAKLVEAPTRAKDTNGESEPSAKEQATLLLDDSQLSPTPTSDVNGNHSLSGLGQEIPELDSFQAPPEDTTTQAEGQPNRKHKKAPTKAKTRRTAKSAREANSTKKTQGWQDYLREEFSDVPLSVAVSAVMQQRQEQVLEINTVVDAIFVQQMPPSVRDKARDRVNNILSDGVRKNKWYRAGGGSYSMSAVANSDELAS